MKRFGLFVALTAMSIVGTTTSAYADSPKVVNVHGWRVSWSVLDWRRHTVQVTTYNMTKKATPFTVKSTADHLSGTRVVDAGYSQGWEPNLLPHGTTYISVWHNGTRLAHWTFRHQ